eukprot:8032797-Lingulodinium_polyedra.AAC.1
MAALVPVLEPAWAPATTALTLIGLCSMRFAIRRMYATTWPSWPRLVEADLAGEQAIGSVAPA